ncbi:B12-binding domain-containing radical SAM protein [bacterium]|nr:B12-binding domain-containing radical SAM protein [bacterium]
MKVFVLNAPYFKKFSRGQRSPAVTKSGTIYFPIWLSYCVGVLENNGFNVTFIDAPARGLELGDVIKVMCDCMPSLVVMDSTTPSIINDMNVLKTLKKEYPKAFYTFVGTHPSALTHELMNECKELDAIARGEYDYTIRDLAFAIKNSTPFDRINGLTYRKNGNVIDNPNREIISNLDELPFVSRTYKKHLIYKDYFNPNALYPQVTIITGRGCPQRCTFCVFPQTLHGRVYRARSPENVVEEFIFIEREFEDAKAVFIEDDTFTTNKKRCQEISKLLIDRGVKISWTANSRADVDYETMEIMKKAGCRSLCVGFESGDEEILNNIHKDLTIEGMHRFMDNANKAGMIIHGCFMAGCPGETKETLERTLALAKSLNPDTAQFYPIMIYPGTEAYEWFKERDYVKASDYSQWLTSGGLHNSIIETPELTGKDLVRFCDRARKEFYLRPGYIFYKLKQLLLHPEEIRRTFKSFRTFFKYLLRGSYSKQESCE